MSNTEFEGGDDGHGHDDHTFLVKQAQPSHIPKALEEKGNFDHILLTSDRCINLSSIMRGHITISRLFVRVDFLMNNTY